MSSCALAASVALLTRGDLIATFSLVTTQSDQRKALGLTQEQAARLAGVSVSTWRRWERKPGSVTAELHVKCSLVLNGDEFEDDALWADVEKIFAEIREPEQSAWGRIEQAAKAFGAMSDLLKVSEELLAANLQPSPTLRMRWGMAVMRAKMWEALLQEGATLEDASTAVSSLVARTLR